MPIHTYIHAYICICYCREAAMQAKLQSTAERIQKVAGLKDKWAKEKERKMQSHRDKRAEGEYIYDYCLMSVIINIYPILIYMLIHMLIHMLTHIEY